MAPGITRVLSGDAGLCLLGGAPRPGQRLLGGIGMSWGPGLYLRKRFGGVTGVYLSVGRGDDQPVMINPGLSPEDEASPTRGAGVLRVPLVPPLRAPHQALGPVAQPTEPGRCCSRPCRRMPGYWPVLCPHPRLGPPTARGRCQRCPPEPGKREGPSLGGRCCGGPSGAVAPLCQVGQSDPPSLEPGRGGASPRSPGAL